MDGRGGCCIARYAGGGGAYDTSKMNRIMLKFRPIAPKPATSGSVSGGTSPAKSDIFVGIGRPKRRYVRDKNNTSSNTNNKKRKKKGVSLPETETAEKVVTFPFLPEKPDQKDQTEVGYSDSPPFDLTVKSKPVQNIPIWMKNSNNNNNHSTVVMPQPVRPVGSCVVVGCLTETFMDGGGEGEGIGIGIGGLRMGCTDEEKRYNLEMDTCPGFISDGLNRVRWTNEAYRRMVNQDDDADHHQQVGGSSRPEMVWLVMENGLLPPVECPAFTCRVRLKYTCRKERSSLTVPCDVWRMDGGGFAWRLDVKAALCLGR